MTMSDVRNPDSREWAAIEQEAPGFSPAGLAERVTAGRVMPWVHSFLPLTDGLSTVLDLGSGTGHASATLAFHGRQCTLMDLSADNLAFSRRLLETMGLHGQFIQGDITAELPFDDATFDVVLCCSVLQFFDDAQLRRLRDQALRVARRRVIFTAPNARCLAYRLGKRHLVAAGRWRWGRERHFPSLRPVLSPDGTESYREFTVGTLHGLSFLTMPGGRLLRRLLHLAGLRDHARPATLRQGYMLVGVLDKSPLVGC